MERTRKIQRIGTAYYLALPPDWIKHCGLQKGDVLVIEHTTKPFVRVRIPSPLVELKSSERERKLQKLSGSYYIALHPDWLKRWGLQKGDELVIEYGDKPIIRVKIPSPLVTPNE